MMPQAWASCKKATSRREGKSRSIDSQVAYSAWDDTAEYVTTNNSYVAGRGLADYARHLLDKYADSFA